MKVNLLVLPVMLAGMVFANIQPAHAAEHLSANTVKLWCNLGHGGAATVKLGPLTWNNFDYLAANAVIGMTKVPDVYAKNPSEFWTLNGGMGGAGSEAESVLDSWLQEIAGNAPKLPTNVDAIRAIAVQLRVAVNSDPRMFGNDASNIRRTKKALAQFARFEKAYADLAPGLSGACAGS